MADKVFGIAVGDPKVKWLLIAGLALVLVAVLCLESGAPPAATTGKAVAISPHPSADAAAGGEAHAAAGAQPRPQPAAAGGSSKKVRGARRLLNAADKDAGRSHLTAAGAPAEISEDSLQAALDFDPFTLSAPLRERLGLAANAGRPPAPDAEQLAREKRQHAAEQRLREFRAKKTSAIMKTADGSISALIDNHLLHEGDVIDGVRVVSITADGVVLEAIAPEEPSGSSP